MKMDKPEKKADEVLLECINYHQSIVKRIKVPNIKATVKFVGKVKR